MDNVRFILASVAVFVLAFVGMSWGHKGFPVIAMRAEPTATRVDPAATRVERPAPTPVELPATQAEPPMLDARVPPLDESVTQEARKERTESKPPQSEGDRERDQLRIELLQAAIGYKLSPCDPAMKKNLVAAVTNYTKAWRAAFNCKLGVDGCPTKADDRVDYAAGLFKTPADINVQKHLAEAYQQGGITKADFPALVGRAAFVWTGTTPGSDKAACVTAREAENRR